MACNTYMYILYYLLYAGIDFWFLSKLSKMEKSLMNSSYQHLPGVDPENSEKGGWDTCPLASYIEMLHFSENSIKIIQKNVKEKRPSKSTLTVAYNVTAPLGKLLLKFSSQSTAFMLVNQPPYCSIPDYPLSWQMLLTHWTSHELLHYSPRLSDSTFVAPCQWCAKLVTDYSAEKICEKLCFDELVYL